MSDDIPRAEFVDFDPRTKANLNTLLPEVRPKFEAWLKACYEIGIPVKIISGSRTYAEQDALYAQGRTEQGPIVTNARGGYSNHNFGVAVDMGIFDINGKYLDESPLYQQAGQLSKAFGLEYGGDWKGFPDDAHVQYNTGLTLSEMRERVAKGESIV